MRYKDAIEQLYETNGDFVMDGKQLARFIDATLVRNNNTISEIQMVVEAAKRLNFASVITMPCYTELLAKLLKPSNVMVGGVLGFPWGAECTEVKVYEAVRGVRDGADELDMVLNLGYLSSGEYGKMLDDICAVKHAIGEVPLKVIIESPMLDDKMIVKAAEVVLKSGVEFIKTATGFNGATTLEQVRLIHSVVGDKIKIKAAGGIRTLQDAEALIEAGASRLGIGAASAIGLLEGKC